MYDEIKKTGAAGVGELVVTYPIDYLKTLRQSGNSNKLFWSNPYRGIGARIIAVLPVRMVFWGTYNITHQYQLSPLKAALFMSTCETIVDFPAEQIKVKRMLSEKHIKIKKCFHYKTSLPSFATMFARNFTFLTVYHFAYKNGDNQSIWNAPIAGFIGSIVSHPLDTIKTFYQSRIYSQELKLSMLTPAYVFRGCGYRCLANFVGMGIGDILIRSCSES